MTAPLDGVRVLDFTRVLSGPYATMALADLGADVVKVEHPEGGDDTRSFGPPFTEGVSTYFLSVNRGKRSVALDLKSPGDRAAAHALALVADVLIENFRPGVMDRLGLGADALRSDNPRLVYCSISGFGREEPGRPGYDLMVQGLGGIPTLTGAPDGPPNKCGASIADLVAGLNAVQGVLAALLHRQRTDRGSVVDVPMLDGQLSLLTYHASAWLNGGVRPMALGNAHPSIHPFRAYAAADGWLNICVGNDAIWRNFCVALDLGGLATDDRFAVNPDRVAHRDALDGLLAPVVARRTVAAWQEILDRAGVPCGPVLEVPAALEQVSLAEHEHPEGGPRVRSVPLPFRIDAVPRTAQRRAPRLGEHTHEVLTEWLVDAPQSGAGA